MNPWYKTYVTAYLHTCHVKGKCPLFETLCIQVQMLASGAWSRFSSSILKFTAPTNILAKVHIGRGSIDRHSLMRLSDERSREGRRCRTIKSSSERLLDVSTSVRRLPLFMLRLRVITFLAVLPSTSDWSILRLSEISSSPWDYFS